MYLQSKEQVSKWRLKTVLSNCTDTRFLCFQIIRDICTTNCLEAFEVDQKNNTVIVLSIDGSPIEIFCIISVQILKWNEDSEFYHKWIP